MRAPIVCQKIIESLAALAPTASGNLNLEIGTVRSWENGESGSLVFVSKSSDLKNALQTKASCLVAPESAKTEDVPSSRCVIWVKDVPLAMSIVKSKFFSQDPRVNRTPQVHSSALVEEGTSIPKSCYIEAFAKIGKNVRLGERCYVGSFVVIEDDCVIGDDTILLAQVYIGPRTQIGKSCTIKPQAVIGGEGFGFAHDQKGHHHRIPQTGRVVIEDHADIGSLVTIDRAAFEETRIGTGVKIDNHVHIAHNCTIGAHTLVAGGTKIAGSTNIGRHNILAGNVTVTDHVSTVDQVMLSGLSVVSKSVTKAGAYGGYPLRPLKEHLRATVQLMKLSSMQENIDLILEHLKLAPSQKKRESSHEL